MPPMNDTIRRHMRTTNKHFGTSAKKAVQSLLVLVHITVHVVILLTYLMYLSIRTIRIV